MKELEESATLKLDFSKLRQVGASGETVLPAVVQDADTKDVLLVAYVNPTALEQSLQTRIATFWSTSRQELWIKGKTSGDYLDLVEIRVNCEQNSLLYLVRPRTGACCHTKKADGEHRSTCYYRKLEGSELEFLPDLI
jgi:phosphoribosyl-AMP cyclohydrolase